MIAARPRMITAVSPTVHGSTSSACHSLAALRVWLLPDRPQAVSGEVRELDRTSGAGGHRARRVRQSAGRREADPGHQWPGRRELVGQELPRAGALPMPLPTTLALR